jgi:hypothetical protein
MWRLYFFNMTTFSADSNCDVNYICSPMFSIIFWGTGKIVHVFFVVFQASTGKKLRRKKQGNFFLADQLTLFQPGGTDYAPLIITGTPGFSDLPTALVLANLNCFRLKVSILGILFKF